MSNNRRFDPASAGRRGARPRRRRGSEHAWGRQELAGKDADVTSGLRHGRDLRTATRGQATPLGRGRSRTGSGHSHSAGTPQPSPCSATRRTLVTPAASRKHAMISFNNEGRWVVNDLGSANGIFIAGARVDSRTLTVGDPWPGDYPRN